MKKVINRQLGIVFPGQGSQSVGMLSDLAEQFDCVQSYFDRASDALNYDVWELVQEDPEEKLNQTEFTQPALLTADVAVYACWQAMGGAEPVVLAGHSLGEYSALVCGGAIKFEDAVKLVAKRGRYMQAAVPEGEGAMAAIIGLEDDQVKKLCKTIREEKGGIVEPANYNSIGQVVIAGQAEAVDYAVLAAKEAGAKIAKRIPVSVPSHCSLMQSAADALAKDLSKVNIEPPMINVLQNVDGLSHEGGSSICRALVEQLTSPVRWVKTIERMLSGGVIQVLECGPGKVLTGLNKRISTHVQPLPGGSVENLELALRKFKP